jgi:hypothetical protein
MAKPDFQVNFTAVSQFNYRRSSTGPPNGILQYQVGSGPFTNIANLSYATTSSSGGVIGPIDLSGIADLQGVGAGTNITFRIVNYGGTGSTGSWYIYNTAGLPSTATDLALQGELLPSGIPTLAIQPAKTNVILSWPAVFGSYTLQQNDDLSTANWSTAGFTATTNNETISVTIPSVQGTHFFRLSHP